MRMFASRCRRVFRVAPQTSAQPQPAALVAHLAAAVEHGAVEGEVVVEAVAAAEAVVEAAAVVVAEFRRMLNGAPVGLECA
jgi:hypothetical protein